MSSRDVRLARAITNEVAYAGSPLPIQAGVRVDDLLYTIDPDPVVGTRFDSITGPLYFSFGNFKIAPRSADDVVGQVQP